MNLEEPGLFLEANYDLSGEIRKLAAYQDINYLIIKSQYEKFILKITVNPDDLDFIRSQNRVLSGLSKSIIGKLVPTPLPASNGELIVNVDLNGTIGYARLFQFIEGDFLAESKPEILFYSDLGRVFGQIDKEMSGMEDAVLKCRTHDWDLARVMEVTEDAHLISDPADRRLVAYFLMKYREEVLPVYYKLPKTLIHGDGNDWNVLVGKGSGLRRDDRVAGVIDFGDMVWGARVHEVAIVLAYAMMGREDFADVYKHVVEGYQEIIQLTDQEINLLPLLVSARWCQTIVMAARQEKEKPGSAYHQVSVQGAKGMLHKWIAVNRSEIVKNVKNDNNVKSGEGVDERYRYFSKAVSLSYKEPIHMVGAAMQYMYSADGRTYLDCVNNIPHVGHCHPRVVESGQRQMAMLNTNTRYLYNSLDRYAEKLLSKFPASLNKVFFVNSGSAATDLAVRLAEAYTGQCEYIVLDYAYHGNTKAAIGLSPYKFNRKGGKGKPDHVAILGTSPFPNATKKPHQVRVETDNYPSLRHAQTFFAESIVGCAGQIVLSKEFMQQTVADVRSGGGIYIADEVQTGFGRVGHKFWGYELYDVVPDIVILGKPMGNGHPMGAVVCTDAIARSFETGMEFFSSFGGNPVSCEIGLAVLEVIEEEGLQENARLVGDFLLKDLQRSLIDGNLSHARHDSINSCQVSDVRGSGLFLGIELMETETGKPAGEAAGIIVNEMKEKGFLLSTDGPFNNIIKFKPPMCFSMQNAEELVENLRRVL